MLPNITIDLASGRMGRVAETGDGVVGMVLTGTAQKGYLELNKPYTLSSVRDLTSLDVTGGNNPLIHKEVSQFYAKAGDGAELWLLVVSEATTLTQMCTLAEGSPLVKLVGAATGRIRIVGVNRTLSKEYTPEVATYGIDADAVNAGEKAQAVAEYFTSKISPIRVLIPAVKLTTHDKSLFQPRQSTWNRVGYVAAADRRYFGNSGTPSAAIGQVLGVAASLSVHQSIARVKNGMASLEGWLTDGRTPEEAQAVLDLLHDAGYIIYRTFPGRRGYYFNDDPMAAPASDDYSNLSLGRTIDKAIMLAYDAYVGEMGDNVEIDPETGKIPVPMCRYYEGLLENAVAARMDGEISGFKTFVDPEQNVLRDERLVVAADITPKGTLKKISITLGFRNPATKSN